MHESWFSSYAPDLTAWRFPSELEPLRETAADVDEEATEDVDSIDGELLFSPPMGSVRTEARCKAAL